MKTWSLLAGLFVFAVCFGLVRAEEAPAKALFNDKCPISGKDVNPEKTSEYKVEFCCENCKAKFDKDPATYMEKVAEGQPGKCVFSGEDATTSETLTIGFCCDNCKGKFDKDPSKLIGKVKPAEKSE